MAVPQNNSAVSPQPGPSLAGIGDPAASANGPALKKTWPSNRWDPRVLVLQCAVVTCLLLLWEVAVRSGLTPAYLYGQPSGIWLKAVNSIASGSLLRDSWVTFEESVAGFVIGGVLGTAAGLALWISPLVGKVARPIIVALNGVPKIALAPLIIIWFGIDVGSKVASAAILTFIVSLITAQSGTSRVDADLLTLMRSLGASRWQTFRKVVMPATVPWIMAGLRLNVGFALIGAVVGEYIAAKEGLGYLVYYAGTLYDLNSVWLGIFALMLMALVLDGAVTVLERALRWE
ncbi:MAG: binding-protein-dependent transport system inner rane component [Bradyrhizobium sp.]|jgi:NitT/TauT family transport system permease protein|nr:binding-protein-dependent transport system inner rane component [Bradyrhizobium sp.]MEA2868536.1 NitT/TauT family transport system permease protein [Bradyrhizobium sp.]